MMTQIQIDSDIEPSNILEDIKLQLPLFLEHNLVIHLPYNG